MAKNIVICSDGTGNSDIKGRGTNVFKLFEAIDVNGHRTNPDLDPQVVLYDDGVGTEDFKPLKIFAGVTGFGLSRNVRQLYKEFVRIYDPGDRIYLFGFSRGAFTIRTLVDFIAKCGVLDVAKLPTADMLESTIRKAYRIYRKCYRTEFAKLFRNENDERLTEQFRKQYCINYDVSITFVGVWDTVDAVGMPFHISDFINLVFYRFKFPDYHLSTSVQRACHALALDDERHSFHPLLWHEQNGDSKRIEQVWFAGAHSNVGGGYPKQGMSLVTLEWMMQKAVDAGLRVLRTDGELYHDHANVDDKLYDPRAGVGVFYRWKPRDITALCRENNVRPMIHLSVLERIAHGTDDYAPGNLPPNASVVITPTGNAEKDAAAAERAREAELILRGGHADGRSLLCRVPGAIFIGRVSYYLYLLTCSAALIAAAAPAGVHSLFNPWLLIKNAGVLIVNIVTLELRPLFAGLQELFTLPGLLAFLAIGFLTSYLLALFADQRMSNVFSQFWHELRPDLRDALKRARKSARAYQNKKEEAA